MKHPHLLALLTAWLVAPLAHSLIVIQPLTEATSKDSKIYVTLPAFSLQSDLNVVSADIAYFAALVQFDLASLGSLTASQITSASLTLYSPGLGLSGGPAVGGTVTISPILNAWRETMADPGNAPLSTHDAFFGSTPTLTLGSVAALQTVSGAGFVHWDVTSLVQSWWDGSLANNGVLIQLSSAGGDIAFADVNSAPAVIGSAPSLTVIPEPSTYALLLVSLAVVTWQGMRRRHRPQPPIHQD